MKRRSFNNSSRLSRLLLIAFALFMTFTLTGGAIHLSPSVSPAVMAQDDPVPAVVNEPTTGTFSNTAQITFGNTAPFPSPSTPYPSTINVTGQGGITKVTVTINDLTHTFPDDIEILLVSPGGQKITLMGDAGGNGDVLDIDITFDDAAASSLPDSTPPGLTSGTFKPTYFNTGTSGFPSPAPPGPYSTTLSVLNGTIQNGTWSLYTVDDSLGDLGDIGMGWSITITAPTLADMGAIAARSRADGQSLVKWTTGYESDNLGFNVYREAGDRRVRLNSQLIAGSALLSNAALTAGRTYRWRDSLPPGKSDARYFIEEIDLNGESRWHGPIVSGDLMGTIKDADFDLAQSATIDDLNQGGAAPPATAAVETRAAQTGLMSVALAGKTNLSGRAGVKMLVKREGLYRVTQEELAAAGFDTSVNPRFIQLLAGGREHPISVIGAEDGRFDAGDAIEFYGVGLDSAWTDARAYFLIAGSQPAIRINTSPTGRGPAAEGSFPYTVERKDRAIYFSALRNGDKENFFGAVVAREPLDQALRLSSISSRATPAELEIALQGVTLASHDVSVTLNGTDVGVINFKDQAQGLARFSVDQSLLKEGENTVRLTGGGDRDISLVDYIRLTYWRDYRAENNSLSFTAGASQQVTIDGFTGSFVRVFDVTDAEAGAVTELMGAISSRDGATSVTVSTTGAGTRRLVAFASDLVRRPAALTYSEPAGLRQKGWKADFVIISRREFFDALKPLKKLRQSQGYKVVIVDVEDIYNEFSYGNKSPQAIKEFLAYAHESWKRGPRFVLLAGDASFDAKNYLGLGDYDLVPTRLVDTDFMETASDEWLADFDSNGLAELAMGRLPVRTAQEAARLVEKIVAYDRSRPSDGILLVADSNVGYDFDGLNARLTTAIPSAFKVEQIKRSSTDDATARTQVIEALNRGQKVVNYTGHGNLDLWRGGILTSQDAAALTNRESLSLFVMMTCLNGYFGDPSIDSLGEALVKSEGGAIAVWASTGMTVPTSQSIINQDLLRVLFSTSGRAPTLGEATMRAKSSMADMDVRRTWVLLGDPTTRLR